eukprot:sb/3476642/
MLKTRGEDQKMLKTQRREQKMLKTPRRGQKMLKTPRRGPKVVEDPEERTEDVVKTSSTPTAYRVPLHGRGGRFTSHKWKCEVQDEVAGSSRESIKFVVNDSEPEMRRLFVPVERR